MYNNKINLAILKSGEKAKIVNFDATLLPAKFYELGFVPGATIEVKHKAPLNGPICVHIQQSDTLVALRVSEAKHILVEKLV